jgi:hypothetical protein
MVPRLRRGRSSTRSARFTTSRRVRIPTASIEVNRPQEIEQYARMFEVLKKSAVYGAAAKGLITKTIEELT